MRELTIGMIGAGFIGQLAHLMNFVEIPHCKVLALAEYKPELRRKVAARYDIPYTYATHHELLENPNIDAVIVVTPRSFTGPIVFDCLKAGKHVLSEKPMAGSAEQGKLLLDTSLENKVRYAVGYMKRFDEGVEATKRILNDALTTGNLGKIISVQATCYMGNSYCNPYGHVTTQEIADYPIGGGWNMAPSWLPVSYHKAYEFYLNTHSHVTNLLRYLFDYTPSVEFVNLTEHEGQLVVLKFNHFLATLQTGKMSHRGWSEEIKITFTDGEIVLSMPPALLRNIAASVTVYRAGKIQEQIQPLINWSWAFRRQAECFVDDILNHNIMRNSAKEAYEELLLIESLWKHEMQRLGMKNKMEVSYD